MTSAPQSFAFPRKNIGLYTILAIMVAASSLLLPMPTLMGSLGFHGFQEGGAWLWLSLLLSLALAPTLAVLGAFAIRGRRAPGAAVALVSALPLLAAAAFTALELRGLLNDIGDASIDPAHKLRIVAEGIAEGNVVTIFGCMVGGMAMGAASVALLGAVASVDRSSFGAPPGRAWVGSLVAGVVTVIGVIGLRAWQGVLYLPLLVILPAVVLVTTLACIAARNGPLVRGWRDANEANAWIAALVSAAILAATGIVFLDVASMYFAEYRGLGAAGGESVDPSQRARILADAVNEVQAAKLYAPVDGALVFAIVALAGRDALNGASSAFRALKASPFALGAAAVAVLALASVHEWRWAKVKMLRADVPTVALPRVPPPVAKEAPSLRPVLVVDASGKANTSNVAARDVFILAADRRAKWQSIETVLRGALAIDRGSTEQALPELGIRVVSEKEPDGPDLGALGRYALFGVSDEPTIQVSLTPPSDATSVHRITPKPTDEWEKVVRSINDASPSDQPRKIVLLPQEGAWR